MTDPLPSQLLGATGLKVSRLGLGSAEIGFAYGLGAPTLPSEGDAIALLKRSVELGITFFDTANYYGLAEERIGKSGILRDPRVIVCTKCAQFLEKGEYFEAPELERRIREQVEGSLKNLRLDVLPLLLIHGPSVEQINEGVLSEIILKLKAEEKIRFAGASVRGEETALALLESSFADAMQIAFSIADRRMASRVFPKAIQNGTGIINRSVYLKGVFAGRAQHLPKSLVKLPQIVTAAQKIAEDAGMLLPELALRYTLSESAIATSLIGTSKMTHIESACAAIEKGPLSPDTIAALETLAIDDTSEIDPARWGI